MLNGGSTSSEAQRQILEVGKVEMVKENSISRCREEKNRAVFPLYTFFCQIILSSHDRGFSFERNCVLRRWESETLKLIINHRVDKVNYPP